jgi:hypothetical protein
VPLVPGIDAPLSVEGGDIQLQLTAATKMDTYSDSLAVYRPESEADIFIFVNAKVLSGDLNNASKMHVSIIDENGRKTEPVGFTIVYPNRKGVGWLIAVARSSHSFTLHLPNNHMITLDSLISSVRRP